MLRLPHEMDDDEKGYIIFVYFLFTAYVYVATILGHVACESHSKPTVFSFTSLRIQSIIDFYSRFLRFSMISCKYDTFRVVMSNLTNSRSPTPSGIIVSGQRTDKPNSNRAHLFRFCLHTRSYVYYKLMHFQFSENFLLGAFLGKPLKTIFNVTFRDTGKL